jgi:hypothetical protein
LGSLVVCPPHAATATLATAAAKKRARRAKITRLESSFTAKAP